MSGHEHTAIPFDIHYPQEGYRLLELPQPLLELITSDNRPKESLQLKSTADNATGPSGGNAVLCTETQTYSLRQVHTSNSVFILQPSRSEEAGVTSESVSAIARCPTTLELVPSALSGTAYLKSVLPPYTVSAAEHGQDDSLHGHKGSGGYRSREAVLNDAPLSRQEFHLAWGELCAFEQDGSAMLPTASALYALWKAIMSASTIKGIKLDESLYVNSIADAVEDDGFPRELVHAVIRRLSVEQTVPMEGWANIATEICVAWLGTIILDSRATSIEGTPETMFLQEWQNLLPEAWIGHVSLTVLKGKYFQPAKGKIMSSEAADKAGCFSVGTPVPVGKRLGKWHEKFGNERR